MKNNYFSMAMMAIAALTMTTNCAKQEEELSQNDEPSPVEEVKETPGDFELFAISNIETKTVNDGMSTKWAGTDALNIFHAEASTTSYVDDDEFSTSDSDKDAGRFSGTLGETLDSGKDYDWYAIYPYKSGITTPANTSTYLYIGGPTNVIPEQNGNNSKAHIAGSNFPMFGKASAVAYNETPSITLEHLASVLEVQVTNNSTAPITVEDVVFTAPSGKSIFGQYIINFAADPITYTDGTYTVETSTLSVVDADPIAVGETASFFLAVKPFVALSGETIKLAVNGFEKTVTLAKNFTFEAGKFKRLTFNYNKEPDVYTRVTALEAFSDGGKYVFALQDGADEDTYYFLQNNGTSNNIDKGLTVASHTTITNPNKQYIFTAEAASSLFKFKNSSNKYIYCSGNTTLNTNSSTESSWAVSTVEGGYYRINLSNTNGRYISYGSNSTDAKAYLQTSFKNQHTAPGSALSQYAGALTVFKLGGYTPPAGIGNATVNDVPARGASGRTQVVTLTNYATAPTLNATPDGTVITAASVTAVTTTSATITYTIADNYSGAIRAGSITIEDTDSNEGTITVNQVADVFSVTKTAIELNANAGASATFTVRSDFDWTIDDSSLSGFTVSPNSFTYTSTQTQTVTITATGNNATSSPVELDIFCVTRTADSKDSDDITVSQKSAKLAPPVLTITPDAANKKFTVAWEAVDNASKYEYYVLDESADYKVVVTQTADASTRTFDVESINLGEEYTVAVKALGNDTPWITSDEAIESVTVSSGSHYYVKVTALDQLSVGDKILIVNESHNGLGAFTTTSTQSATTLSAAYDSENDRFDASNAAVISCSISLESPYSAGTNVYSLKQSNNYYIIKTGTSGTGFNPSTTKSTTASGDWTFSMQSARIRIKNNTSDSSRAIIWRAGTTNAFGAYATSNVNSTEYYDLNIYKYQ